MKEIDSFRASMYEHVNDVIVERVIKFAKDLDKLGIEADAILFGSCAIGYANYFSDIDILIVTPTKDFDRIPVKELVYSYDYQRLPINLTFRSYDTFVNSTERFECQIKAKGIIIYANGLFKDSIG